MRDDGYVALRDVLTTRRLKSLRARAEEIVTIVQDSDKQRFELTHIGGTAYVRATQGHSIPLQDDLVLQEILEPPPIAAHGTYKEYYASIYGQR